MSNKLNMVVGSDNVFHDLGFAEPEAQNLLLRADLVSHIRKVILKLDITQAEAYAPIYVRLAYAPVN
jgi:predicted XRE-type DNA-binding protein